MIDLDTENVSHINRETKSGNAMNERLSAAIEPAKEAARKYRRAFKSGRLTMESNGHVTGYESHRLAALLDTWTFWWYANLEVMAKVVDLLDHPLETPFDPDEWYRLKDCIECENCGKNIQYYTNGRVIKAAEIKHVGFWSKAMRARLLDILFLDQPCVYAEGLPTPTHEIDVPSGWLVLGNDLRYVFDGDLVFGVEGDRTNINAFAGKLEFMEKYAEAGMLTAYMGSAGPDVYVSPTSIILGRGVLVDPENDDDTRSETIVLDGITHYLTAHISCRLWWFGAADWGRMKEIDPERAGNIEIGEMKGKWPECYSEDEYFRVAVQPGKWRMTHYGKHRGEPVFDTEPNANGDTIVSRLQWVEGT